MAPSAASVSASPVVPRNLWAVSPLTVALLLGVLILWGIAEALFVFVRCPPPLVTANADVLYGFGTAAIILFLCARHGATPGAGWRASACPAWAAPALIVGAFGVTLLLAQFAMEAIPNSGDEYGYTYLADTLLHGRLWNPPRPAALHDVLETMYIVDRDGRRLSQYAPGWPALLAGFLAIGLPQLANPVVGLCASGLLWLALRQLGVGRAACFAALLLGAAAPFWLFNAASFFSHSLTGACLLAIIWLDLRDGRRPSAYNRAGIGVAFSVLLATRYEDFAIAFALFALDGLIRRGWRLVPWAAPAALAGAPLAAALLFYNWRITGNPFETSLAWASPQIGFGLHAVGVDGPHSALRGVSHSVWWALDWQNFASALILPLYCIAAYRRLAARRLRWFDLVLPSLVVFFFFFPDSGGYQYGPRYWYFGFAAMPVTVAAGLTGPDGLWRVRQVALDPMRLALAQLAAFAGFSLGLALLCHLRAETRMLPLRIAATVPPPALVLLRDGELRYSSVQLTADPFLASDLSRNGLRRELPPVAIGIDLGPARTRLLCRQMPDRHIYRLEFEGAPSVARLQPACPPPAG